MSDKLQLEIDQLRKDKIIYAVEACAVTLISILIFFFSNSYLAPDLRHKVNIGALILAVGYTIFMGVGNSMRWMRIKKLEKRIK